MSSDPFEHFELIPALHLHMNLDFDVFILNWWFQILLTPSFLSHSCENTSVLVLQLTSQGEESAYF